MCKVRCIAQRSTEMIELQPASSLSELNILVAGVARNCEKTIQRDVFRLSESLKGCKALLWLVIESDSFDKTPDELQSLQSTLADFRFLSLGTLQHAMPIRTERIAHCRNVYLDELKSNPLYAEVDYLVVADLDGVNDLVTAQGFASCWTRSDWDVCTANQRGPYYDIWALRHPLWSPNDCWRQYHFLLEHGARREDALWAAMYTKMFTISENEDWIEVDSAFGGLAVYRKEVVDGVVYEGLDDAGEGVCEHVSVNTQIRSRGQRIFINPKLINAAETDQAHQRMLTQQLKRRYLDLRHETKKKILGVLRSN